MKALPVACGGGGAVAGGGGGGGGGRRRRRAAAARLSHAEEGVEEAGLPLSAPRVVLACEDGEVEAAVERHDASRDVQCVAEEGERATLRERLSVSRRSSTRYLPSQRESASTSSLWSGNAPPHSPASMSVPQGWRRACLRVCVRASVLVFANALRVNLDAKVGR